ncbi:S1 family peptidase [Paractinoplanes hotanensis]|uniref:Trypsin-like serine protease n=1 Tax=Paractinoplanes hotanensis TaxID=2906497 RepID=A0ABT0YC30_9ACTN|nr:trypsin-like serine protease [Actinoplanes hotanensis]MCM4083606.1 trypsin-like serine protease [Actinoplanes hotanensis]
MSLPRLLAVPDDLVRRFLADSLLVLLVVAAVLGLRAPGASAIAYGEDASDGAYGFSVLLTATGLPTAGGGTRDSWCSGALIAPRWVITAGHCFRDISGQRVSRTVARRTTATVGRTDLRTREGQEVDVVAVYQADKTDVALARLATEVTGVTPLRVGTTPPAVGEILRLTGYGLATDGGPTVAATRLQTGRFTVVAIGDTLMEASGRAPRQETSPCSHDSGGPYFRERVGGAPELVAVVSTGPPCPHRGPDFSARTDTLQSWIAGTMVEPPDEDRSGTNAWLLAGLPVFALILFLVIRRRGNHRQKVTAAV